MIENTWDFMPIAPREAVCRMAGWRTARGVLNQTGRKVSRQSWADMSPAAKTVLARYYAGKASA